MPLVTGKGRVANKAALATTTRRCEAVPVASAAAASAVDGLPLHALDRGGRFVSAMMLIRRLSQFGRVRALYRNCRDIWRGPLTDRLTFL